MESVWKPTATKFWIDFSNVTRKIPLVMKLWIYICWHIKIYLVLHSRWWYQEVHCLTYFMKSDQKDILRKGFFVKPRTFQYSLIFCLNTRVCVCQLDIWTLCKDISYLSLHNLYFGRFYLGSWHPSFLVWLPKRFGLCLSKKTILLHWQLQKVIYLKQLTFRENHLLSRQVYYSQQTPEEPHNTTVILNIAGNAFLGVLWALKEGNNYSGEL